MAVEERNGNEEDADPDGCLDGCGFKIVGNDRRTNTQSQVHEPDAHHSLPPPFENAWIHGCDQTRSISGTVPCGCMLWLFRDIPSIIQGNVDHLRACSHTSRCRFGLWYSGVGDASMIKAVSSFHLAV